MERVKARAQVGWRADVLVICWEEFGMEWRSEELAILEEVVLGCCGGFQVDGGDSGLGMAVEWMGVDCWKLVEVRGWILKRIGGVGRSGFREKRRRKLLVSEEEEGVELSWDSLALRCSLSGGKRC